MELRKLSDIIIEIAKQGLSCEKYAHSEVMHALMALAHSMELGDGLGKLYSKRTVHWFHKPAPAVGKKHPQGISFRGLGGHHKPHESIQKAAFPKRSQSHNCLWVHGEGNPPSTMARGGTTNASTREVEGKQGLNLHNQYFICLSYLAIEIWISDPCSPPRAALRLPGAAEIER